VIAARAAGQPYALAFVDMRMPPGWDGLETIEQLWHADPDLQVVICSAFSDYSWGEIRKRLGERDALLILKKPFDTIEVVQCAHALTSKWSLSLSERAHVSGLEAAVRERTLALETANYKLAAEMRERQRVETELRLAQKLEAVGLLAAGIAHEINTPIQYIGDNLELLRGGVADLVQMAIDMRTAADVPDLGLVDKLREIAETADLSFLAGTMPSAIADIVEGIDRISKIVRAMKELAHPTPKIALPTDLNRALGNSLTVSASVYKYVADLETDLEPLPMVTCLGSELNQVFLNLIANAAHAIEDRHGERGKLTVRSRVDGADIVISIGDTGCGIPEAIRDRIFDVFFTTKELGRGTGQGLALSRSIVVDRHGGTLTFESQVGVGTTFHVRIPIDRADSSCSTSLEKN
jgi:two-component system, NtrC family, sensor kinase